MGSITPNVSVSNDNPCTPPPRTPNSSIEQPLGMSKPLRGHPRGAGARLKEYKRNPYARVFAKMADAGTSEPASSPTPIDVPMVGMFEELLPPKALRAEWLGTSLIGIKERVDYQQGKGEDFKMFLGIRNQYQKYIEKSPYDPEWWMTLGSAYNALGFNDIAASVFLKGLLLLGVSARIPPNSIHPCNIQHLVLDSLDKRYQSRFATEDALPKLRLECFVGFLTALGGCDAQWDGLDLAKDARIVCDNHSAIRVIEASFMEAFRAKTRKCLEKGTAKENVAAVTRSGRIYQRQYPWLAPELNFRSSSLLEKINADIGSPCAIAKPLFEPTSSSTDATANVGPLGLFATRDISDKELILVDESNAGVSNSSLGSGEQCEACHAALFAPYGDPQQITRATCCNLAVYCSPSCYKAATNSYHRILCGKDFGWLWDCNQSKLDEDGPWKARLFLRIVATVLSDNKGVHPLQHPLQHPLIARMTSNYPPPDTIRPGTHSLWHLFENVLAPTRILMQLGINIFTDNHWSQEVIQTIIFRIDNNCSQARTNLQNRQGRLIAINPNYLLFNHSCHPNVHWNGAGVQDFEPVHALEGFGERVHAPGSSTILCRAKRDIKKGEELKITYIGNPLGLGASDAEEGRSTKRAMLQKWFPDGCGCETCEKEKQEELSAQKKSMDMMMGVDVDMQTRDEERAMAGDTDMMDQVARLETRGEGQELSEHAQLVASLD